MCGIPRTNSPTEAWGWYVNGGDIFVFWTSDIESCTFLSWCKKLTNSMQTGLRPIMDLDGATIVTSNTGITLTRSPFPSSALYLSQIFWYHVNWNYVLLYNRHIWIKQIKKIPVGTRFSAHVRTGPGVHPASCTMGTVSFPGVKSDRGVTLIPHPLLVPWSRKSRAIPLLPLWVERPVQSLSACRGVHFTVLFYFWEHLYKLCCVDSLLSLNTISGFVEQYV